LKSCYGSAKSTKSKNKILEPQVAHYHGGVLKGVHQNSFFGGHFYLGYFDEKVNNAFSQGNNHLSG
jgi:hypothetical protein